MSTEAAAYFSRELLNWYMANKRDLPWRMNRDPYRIWVSEIMLQQTRVDTVIPYYERFMEKFPTAAALATAPEPEVLKCWGAWAIIRGPAICRRAPARCWPVTAASCPRSAMR